jgi:hypothetical protein
LVLAIAPWTQFWERNYFGLSWPWLGQLMASSYFKGGVTGVGLLTMAAGLRSLAERYFARPADPPGPAPTEPRAPLP